MNDPLPNLLLALEQSFSYGPAAAAHEAKVIPLENLTVIARGRICLGELQTDRLYYHK
jgi:hypothetical protein